jgi:hypothetical protein
MFMFAAGVWPRYLPALADPAPASLFYFVSLDKTSN